MKNLLRLLLPVLFLFALAVDKSEAQVEVVIVGPSELCFGECGTYFLQLLDSNAQIVELFWDINGVTSSTSNPITVCADDPNPSGIQIFAGGLAAGGNGNLFDFETTFFVEVITSSNPVILSTSALCPSDSLTGGCEKICAFNTATYEVTGVPPGTAIDWQVLGAEDFTITGNQISVDWGAPGQGEVSVSVGGSSPSYEPLQIYCGQFSQYDLPNNILGGDGYLNIFGGVPPFDAFVSSPSGMFNVTYSLNGLYQLAGLSPDTYQIIVTDATGATATCAFEIVGTDNDCWVSAYPVGIQHASSCNECDGGIQLQGAGGFVYTFEWSTGETTQSISGLCPGQYSVTLTDDFGCTSTEDFIITCPQNPGCSGEASLCIEILDEPEAEIGSVPTASSGVIEVCEGQTVFFQNESLGASSYAWDFGDLNTSAQFEPNHTYLAAGTYSVQLIAFNACLCSDTTNIEVNVLPVAVPEVNCVGTICEGETVTYSTDVMCSSYDWIVIGSANVLDGGGTGDNFITVEWLAGPEGLISLEVAGCAGTICNVPNVIPIPIISDAVEIQGPNKVCEGSTEEYFIPNYQGTEINWSVIGSGNIVEEQGERITVNWFGGAGIGNPQLVIVEFENCYLGCGGKDTLEVNIRPSFYIEGPIEVCENSTTDYLSRNTLSGAPMLSDWAVFDETAGVVWTSASSTNTANIPWNFPVGKYTVRATAANLNGFCNETYDVFVEVLAGPPPPMSIDGETSICPGEIYTYLANGIVTNDFSWSVTGGTPAVINGNPANVTWNASGPYSLSVVQISTLGLGCESDPISLAVSEIPAFSVTGDDEVCLEEVGIYSVPFFENIDYQWTISPPDVGTIIGGFNSETVGIQWHASGPATVSVDVCGANESFNVNVLALPEPVAQFPPEICAGDSPVVTTSVPYSSYSWKDDSGAQISTLPNPTLGGGHYEVEVIDANGCMGDSIFEIVERDMPPVSISLPSYTAICPGGPNITLYSVTIGGGGYSYEWFLDGNPIGGNTADLVTNQAGNYQVIVTDLSSGCTATSETETLVDCATLGGVCVAGVCTFPGAGCPDCTLCPCAGGSCASNGNIDFNSGATANCDELAFFNTSVDFVPGSLEWNFDDPASGAANTSMLENPTHVFNEIGWYTVLLTGLVEPSVPGGSPCFDYVFYDVLVPVKANFEADPVCPGEAMEFFDRSVFVTGGTITDWEWDFGDPGSGAANTSSLQDPTHTYSTSGTYSVTLTLTEASGCQVSFTQNVTVFDLPTVSFPLPSVTCENTALPFDAVVPADYASLVWDFGDPASGVANSSEIVNSFHEFDAPGPYTVTLTTTSIQGCSNSYTDVVDVTLNPLGGNIAFSQPSPICEGDSVVLTSPPGGIDWIWTSGSINEDITVFNSGVYDVTLTNAEGCTYSPPEAIVDVLAEPNGIIKAVVYNQYGQPTGFFESPYSVCEGEDVFLVVQGGANNSYVWSTTEPGNEISFTDDKNNLLSVGTHIFTVTVTDGVTGCTSEEGPFEVIVNPKPDVSIQSAPSGFLCENDQATLSIVSPDPMLSYQWNTGEVTNSIEVVAGGIYFVQATNQFGCKNRSNEIELNNAPDIDLIPTGCLDRCNPDTMCLPNMGLVNNYQWYLDGNPIAAPNGNLAEPIFDQSGEYYVVMTDVFGCTSTSDVLTLDLFPGFGDILGNVWYDVNGNGMVDAADTLVTGIDIILNDGTVNLDTVTAGNNGYIFVGAGANNYTLELDTTSLPAGWTAYWLDGSVDIVGCDVMEDFDWLVVGCIPSTETIDLSACEGDGATYDGTFIPAGSSQDFFFSSFNGCDSIVTVQVAALPLDTVPLELVICENETVTYDGVVLNPGDVQDFVFANFIGCDSTVQVSVIGLPTSAEALQFETCPNVPIDYQGTLLNVGDVQDFVFTNLNGCDSTVTVSVVDGPADVTPLLLEICENTTTTYDGVVLAPGDMQDFVFTNFDGCDSVVQVSVQGLPTYTENLTFSTCPNVPIPYNGTLLNVGDVQTFMLQTQMGCDSIVTVTIGEAPTPTSQLELETCEGTTIEYEGVTLSPGDAQDFVLLDQYGCDSIVQVSVVGLMNQSENWFFSACPGETIVFGGTQYFAGDSVQFNLQTYQGCDSTVTIVVNTSQVDTTLLTVEVCEGESTNVNGQILSVGETGFSTFINQFGCDSFVIANVIAFPEVSYDLIATEICWNGSDGEIQIINISGSTAPYAVSLDGVDFQPELFFDNLDSGPYSVFLQDANECIFENETEVPAIPPLAVEVQDETMDCGDLVEFFPVIVTDLPYSLTWPDGSSESTFTVDAPGTYILQVTNDCEVLSQDINVSLNQGSLQTRIYMPNSFSPNGDGINDCYQGYLAPGTDVEYFLLRIFDRWGNQMFESNNPDECWDGHFRGKRMDPAVFAWFVEMRVRNCDGQLLEYFEEGGIHLMR